MPKTVNDLQGGFDLTYGARRHGKQSSVTSHIHNYFEIYYLIKGKARYFVNNEFIDLEHGDIIIVKQGLLHKTIYDLKNPCERLLICFDLSFVGEKIYEIACGIQSIKISTISPVMHQRAENLILGMKQEFESDEKNKNDMLRLMLSELIVLFSRNKNKITDKQLSDNEIMIQDAAKYLSDRYSDNLNLDDISKKYAVSACHFSRLFKKYTGFGVTDYITEVRISKAEELLKNTELKITEIASECGYNDSNYFASVFKRKKGMTPHMFSGIYKKRKGSEHYV